MKKIECIDCSKQLVRRDAKRCHSCAGKIIARKNQQTFKKGYIPHNWKGDKVGYAVLHIWVQNKLGKSNICEHCGKSGLQGHEVHWANKSHEYKRELTDWLRLCAKCHKAYDKDLVLS